MSWLFSRALVEAYSADICSDGEPSAPSSETPTPLAYCAPDRMTAFFRLSRFGTTFAPLTEGRGEAALTSYRADFPAKTFHPLAREPESTENEAGYGAKWRASSVRFDRDSRSWKTHPCLFGEALPWSSVTLPRWGMMRDGACWERITPELPTSEIGSGSWLPTPTANEGGRNRSASPGAAIRPSLGMMASRNMWPTPTSSEHKYRLQGSSQQSRSLNAQAGGKLNPTWVEWLMGWPLGWTALEPLGMDKFQAWLRSHGASLADPNEPRH